MPELTPKIAAEEKALHARLLELRHKTGRDGRGIAVGGGWNRRTQEQHIQDGTYRRDRHGPRAAGVLDYPKPKPDLTESIKAARRWIRNAGDEAAFAVGCRFCEPLAEHVANFFPRYLQHSKGQWAGQPFELLPWQRDDLIYPLFGWVRPDGTRRFRRAFIEIAKKNGKSTLASGIGLYMLCADGEPGAEVYSAASDRDQASIVHGEAMRMAESSTILAGCLKINKSNRNIFYEHTRSWYRALSNDPGGKQGLNIHACIIDELHIWHGRDLWDSLRYGYRSRRQPLQFVITTAGDDDQSVCYSELERARAIIRGDVRDDAYFALVYEAQPEDDWLGESIWAKANPSLGNTFAVESLREDALAAKGKASDEAVFKRYSLNIWQRATNPWLSMDDWAKCERQYTLDEMEGRDCYAGLDLSRTRDMTALVLVFPMEENGRTIYRQWPIFWLPEAAVEQYKDRIDILGWKQAGHLALMGETYADVEATMLNISKRFNLIELAFDPMYARDLCERLRNEQGIPAVEYSQTIMLFAGPTAEYERLLIHGVLHHPGNAVLTWQAGNVNVKQDANANKRPVKPPGADYRKIDGIVAGIMALGRAMQAAGGGAYEDHGVLYADDMDEEETDTTDETPIPEEEYAYD